MNDSGLISCLYLLFSYLLFSYLLFSYLLSLVLRSLWSFLFVFGLDPLVSHLFVLDISQH